MDLPVAMEPVRPIRSMVGRRKGGWRGAGRMCGGQGEQCGVVFLGVRRNERKYLAC